MREQFRPCDRADSPSPHGTSSGCGRYPRERSCARTPRGARHTQCSACTWSLAIAHDPCDLPGQSSSVSLYVPVLQRRPIIRNEPRPNRPIYTRDVHYANGVPRSRLWQPHVLTPIAECSCRSPFCAATDFCFTPTVTSCSQRTLPHRVIGCPITST